MKIAIIGSGPTGIYSLKHLIDQGVKAAVYLFESHRDVGKGTPYLRDWNHKAMLANIASIEIPLVRETLVAWLQRQSDASLAKLEIARQHIHERKFYPRIVLGEYFAGQLDALLKHARELGVEVHVRPEHKIRDITRDDDHFSLHAEVCSAPTEERGFTHVILATGHVWPESSEIRPGYFSSPWPATSLKNIGHCSVGIRGTSLSAIDVMVALSMGRGSFRRMQSNRLVYLPEPGTENFRITLMSRKGLLPEADFYCAFPYTPLSICTHEAAQALANSGQENFLDKLFALFQAELKHCDPGYADKIGLDTLTVETFADAYFHDRESHDAFEWAARNLQEAEKNYAEKRVVEWRYAILRMHEVIGGVVSKLSQGDKKRFDRHFKHIFMDDYATVPHESIERLLALKEARKLQLISLGTDYGLAPAETGMTVIWGGKSIHFPAFVEATGQKKMTMKDFAFPSLVRQGLVHFSMSDENGAPLKEEERSMMLDECYHPLSASPLCKRLYCLSLPFILHKHPFAQGITSSDEMGKMVAKDIACQIASSKERTQPFPGVPFQPAQLQLQARE